MTDIRFFSIDDHLPYAYITVHYPKHIKMLFEFKIIIILKHNRSGVKFPLFYGMLNGRFFFTVNVGFVSKSCNFRKFLESLVQVVFPSPL